MQKIGINIKFVYQICLFAHKQ